MKTPDLIPILYAAIEEQLNLKGLTYQKPSGLSKGILEASEYFIKHKGLSPWNQPQFQASYIAHFLPMNIFRWLHLLQRLEDLKLDNLHANLFGSVMDFGAGPITFRLAYALKYPEKAMNYGAIELNDPAIALGEALLKSIAKSLNGPTTSYATVKFKNCDANKASTLILSYSLNELTIVPEEFWHFKNILILEPSQQETARQLLHFRQNAISKHFRTLAPCFHSDSCPMLLHSKKDWCFDRTTIEIPEIAKNLYKGLPFETRHLTFSYLLLSRDEIASVNPPETHKTLYGRSVGDWQHEKGKRKIMFCRSSNREFISCLKKSSSNPEFKRGDQVNADLEFTMKGQELRLK